MTETNVVEVTACGAGLALLAAMAIALARLVRGPRLEDRAVALDLVSLLAVGFAGVAAVATRAPALLDVGLALALVAFLATLAFAWYVERRAERASDEGSPGEGS